MTLDDERLTSRSRLLLAPDGSTRFQFDEVMHTCR